MKEHIVAIFACYCIFEVNGWIIPNLMHMLRAQPNINSESVIGPVQGVLMDFDPPLNHESIQEKLAPAELPYQTPEGLVKISK